MKTITVDRIERKSKVSFLDKNRAWIIVGMLVIFQMINFADKAVLGLVAEPAMRELGLSASQFGFIGGAFFFLFAITAILVGFLAGFIPSRWIILSMGLAWAVLQFPMLLGGGVTMLLVTRIILGAAEGPATPISLQHAQGWFPATDRALPSSWVAMGSTMGPLVAAPVLAWIIAHPEWGWRWAFGFLGMLGLVWSILWLIVCKEGPYSAHGQKSKQKRKVMAEQEQEQRKKQEPEGESLSTLSNYLPDVKLLALMRSPTFLVATFAGAGCFWAQGFLTTWSPKYLRSVVELSPEMIGLISTLPWLMGAMTLFLLGWVSRFVMRRGISVRWGLASLFSVTLALSGFFFALLPSVTGYTAVLCLTIAAGLALIFPLAPTLVAYCVGARQRAAVMAMVTGLASFGGVVAPIMVGYLMQNAGFTANIELSSVAAKSALTNGMNSAFWFIGIYLMVLGALSFMCLNPDGLLKNLHTKDQKNLSS